MYVPCPGPAQLGRKGSSTVKAPSSPFPPLLAAALLATSLTSWSMEIPPEFRKMLGGDYDPGSSSSSTAPVGQSPDNSIDPEDYLIGGGDIFQISIVGMPSQDRFCTVDPDGNLYDKEIGLIPLGKISLAESRRIIIKKMKSSLRKNLDVYVSLRTVKTAHVSVSGQVKNPGTQVVSGGLRILDAIRMANGGVLPPWSDFNFREVKVHNRDSVKTYDFLAFLSRQDPSQNPYVYPGDHISLSPQDARIFVAGEVVGPAYGGIPLKRGETLGELATLLEFKSTADSTGIQLQRVPQEAGAPALKASLPEAASTVLERNDVIIVSGRESGRRADTVLVSGQVRRPGTYSVRPNTATFADVLALAGGPTELGNMDRAVVIRHSKRNQTTSTVPMDRTKPLAADVRVPVTPLMAVRPEVSASITDLITSSDFALIDASGEAGGRTQLTDGDEIHILRKDPFVYVSGNVGVPGAYPYKEGEDYKYYVKLAKGYTNKADPKNRFLLTLVKGELAQIRDTRAISQGDILVIPAGIEYKTYSSVALPFIQMVPAVLSVILTIVLIMQQN